MAASEVNERLEKLGILPSSSSQISLARRRLGLPKRNLLGSKKNIGLDDLEKVKPLPAILGYTIPETIEIIQAVEKHCLGVGGIPRAIEALKTLEKLRG